MPADCREAMQWFVSNFGLYSGSVRGLFLSDFSEEHEASLEASIISLKSRGFNPLVITGEMLTKQAEYLYDQALLNTTFGRPVASKAELDILGTELLILENMVAPENNKQLWYLHNHILYPRALSGKATVVTTPLIYDEFKRYGAGCPDSDFGGRSLTWEKIMWLIDATMINLEFLRMVREESLPPMLKAEYYLYMSLKERGLNVVPQHVLGDYLLDLALVEKDQRLNIECDGLSAVSGYERQADEAKRNLLLLSDGWQILRFTTGEILSNHAACADVVEEVWKTGRKKQPLGRLLTGQTVNALPELPFDDEGQQSAITHGGGPGALIGGAGTGKTTCIVDRVAYLICQGVNPDSILILSNSIDTVKTIKAGLDQILDKQTNLRVQLYAWHDFGFKILKENLQAIKRKAPLKVETNPQKVLQRILEKHKKDLDPAMLELSSGLDEFTVSTLIAIYKANLISPKQVKEQAKDEIGQLIAKVFLAYEEQLVRANRIDREDMVTLAVQVLLERQEVRARYQYNYEFVLVDEYQDVTPAEDALVRLLSAPQDNLYLVGDEDEAIYESKGATSRLLMDLSMRLPQTRCYVLEKNWRSHPAIVDHARQLLTGLTMRHVHKDMTSAYGAAAAGAIIGPHKLASEQAEAEWVADEIQILVDSGRKLRDIAVLYRYHHYGPIVEESLSKRGIRCMASHPDAGLVPDEVDDMLAFLRLVLDPDGPKAKESFERVCQLRTKEIDPKLWTTIASFAEANNLSFLKAVEIYSEATADQSCKDLVQLVRLIRTMKNETLPPAETISLLRRTQRLNDYYKGVSVPRNVMYEPLRKLNQLEEDARKFQTIGEFVKHHTGLRQQLTSGGSAGDPGVHVLTLHESKGLEFPIVFVIGLAEGLFPADNAGNMDEERRLCYLGFTRARELLYLSYPGMFNNVSLQPSSFLVDARLLPAPAPPPVAGAQQAVQIQQSQSHPATAPIPAYPSAQPAPSQQQSQPVPAPPQRPAQQPAQYQSAQSHAVQQQPVYQPPVQAQPMPPRPAQQPVQAQPMPPQPAQQPVQAQPMLPPPAQPPVQTQPVPPVQAPPAQSMQRPLAPAAATTPAPQTAPAQSAVPQVPPATAAQAQAAQAQSAQSQSAQAQAAQLPSSQPSTNPVDLASSSSSPGRPSSRREAPAFARQPEQKLEQAQPQQPPFQQLPPQGPGRPVAPPATPASQPAMPVSYPAMPTGQDPASAPYVIPSHLDLPNQVGEPIHHPQGFHGEPSQPGLQQGSHYPAGEVQAEIMPGSFDQAPYPGSSGDRLLGAPGVMAVPSHAVPSGDPQYPAGFPPDFQAGVTGPHCPNCDLALEANARFCGECGYHLGTRIPSCPLCSAPLEPGAKFCGECGSNVMPIHSTQPLSPGGLPMPGRRPALTQHGWLVKFLKYLEK